RAQERQIRRAQIVLDESPVPGTQEELEKESRDGKRPVPRGRGCLGVVRVLSLEPGENVRQDLDGADLLPPLPLALRHQAGLDSRERRIGVLPSLQAIE